jgi:hypothetical protein
MLFVGFTPSALPPCFTPPVTGGTETVVGALDFEEEVNNNKVLNRGIAEVKAESSNYQDELEEVRKQLDLKTAIIKSQGKTADDLAKSKADAKRLQDKLDDAFNTIAELKVKTDPSLLTDSLLCKLQQEVSKRSFLRLRTRSKLPVKNLLILALKFQHSR